MGGEERRRREEDALGRERIEDEGGEKQRRLTV